MRKLSLILLTAIITFITTENTSAQKGLGLVNAQIQDTIVVVGDTMVITGYIYNYDSTNAFSGNINFKLNLNERDINYGEVEIIPDTMTYNIAPISGSPFKVKIPISLPEFQVGPNVVIIWPISNRTFEDSATKIVNIVYPLGYKELKNAIGFSAALTENGLDIFGNDAEKIRFKRVRIYNIIGNLIAESSLEKINEVQFENKPNQIYLCEFLYNSDKRKVMKLIRY